MKPLKFSYFGSSDFAAALLQNIIEDHELKQNLLLEFVVTQPDKPAGRKQEITPTPVKTTALKNNVEVLTELTDEVVKRLKNIDLVLLYAYGAFITEPILKLPKYGFWNIHPSLLPSYRGTSPMATALINGDKKTGVTLIKMDDKIDHGPIIDQETSTIEEKDDREDLENKLTDMGFELFKKNVMNIDKVSYTPQVDSQATYTKKLKKDDGFVDFEKLKKSFSGTESQKIFNLFRGLYPWPGIWTTLPNGKRLKILEVDFIDGRLMIKKVQLEGKNEVDFETFNKAYKVF